MPEIVSVTIGVENSSSNTATSKSKVVKLVPSTAPPSANLTDAELTRAYRANALFDAHGDDPEFGYRFLVDEAREAGQAMSERTAWSICAENRWWSVFGKKKARGKGRKVGPPVHDDLVGRVFTAAGPNHSRPHCTS